MSALDDSIAAIDAEIATLQQAQFPATTIGTVLVQLSANLKNARDEMDRQRMRHNLVLARLKANAAFAGDAVIQALQVLP